MRKSRFTESQIIGILKAAEGGAKVADLAREHGVSTATSYTWRSKYDGLEVNVGSTVPGSFAPLGGLRRSSFGKVNPWRVAETNLVPYCETCNALRGSLPSRPT